MYLVMKMIIDRVVVGSLETNCYILSIDNNCIVVDPGDDVKYGV